MNSPNYECSIGLYFKGNFVDPGLISKILSVSPTRERTKGIPYVSKISNSAYPTRTSLWALEKSFNSLDVSGEIISLLSVVKDKGSLISMLPGVEEAYLDIYICYNITDQNEKGYVIKFNTDLLIMIASIGVPVYFEIDPL